ncbi:MAG TPA: ATP-binding protein [Methylophilaceae bacterium]|jgi:two-component system OmpR family sensor kinase
MASFKAQLNQSLQLQLSLWLTAIVIILALIAGTFSFVTSFKEMNEVQDDLLRQIASLFDADHLPVAHHGDSGRLANSDEESRVIVQYLTDPSVNPNTRLVDGELPLIFPANLADGIQTVTVENESYRALVKTISNNKKIVIAQETGVRNEIAESGALRTLIPFLILLPILLLTNTILIRKLFKPVLTLAEEINHRNEQDLHAFETRGLPSEISPFVIAINQLLEKVSQSMRAQRRFIADAAHELRSPMTALSLQAEHLANAEMSNQAKERVYILRQGLERNRHLLNQLLELARVQSAPQSRSKQVSIKNTYRNVLEDLHALAEVKQIDIGLIDGEDVELITDEADLFILIKNIVDNAIRYTPNGGKIDLAIKDLPSQTHLIVTDSGPGIPLADRQRVMDPFYRVLGSNEIGSGLGLSIVQGIAAKMGWHINLDFVDEHLKTGLMVTVIIHKPKQ